MKQKVSPIRPKSGRGQGRRVAKIAEDMLLGNAPTSCPASPTSSCASVCASVAMVTDPGSF